MASKRNLEAGTTGIINLNVVTRVFEHDAMAGISSLKHTE
jgi:hypothetical protein